MKSAGGRAKRGRSLAERLYLDHAATSPLLPRARAAMDRGLAIWANPSSPHAEGRAARAALEQARREVAAALGWTGMVIFTAGATEAVALAFARGKAGARIVSAVEHDAVRRAAGGEAIVLPVDGSGLVDPDAACRATVAAGPRPLVAVQAVNSETGVIQPLDAVAGRVRAAGGLLLVDCAQSAGRLPLPAADFVVVSGHKLGGPIGSGALLVRDLATLAPGGGQEQGYRGGTENLPGALGLAAALDGAGSWIARAGELRTYLEQVIEGAGGLTVAGDAPRLPTIGAYRMPGVPAAAQLIRFDLAGIAISAGSACSSGSLKPSAVLTAMGMAPEAAGEVIRVSFGPSTRRADLYRFGEAWKAIAAGVRAP